MAPKQLQSSPVSRKEAVLSRRQIEGLIAEGKKVFIVDGKVLKADAWLPFHPGGDKAIMHMVGRDATDEVNALHSPEARQRMNKFQIGRVEGRWPNFVPPIQGGRFRPLVVSKERDVKLPDPAEDPHEESESSELSEAPSPVFESKPMHTHDLRRRRNQDLRDGHSSRSSSATSLSSLNLDESPRDADLIQSRTKEELDLDISKYPLVEPMIQDEITRKYRLLNERIKNAGLYDCNYWAYAIEGCRYLSLFTSFVLFLNWGWYKASALFLGALWHQLTFTVHDAGHMGITHNFQTDTIIGILLADFVGGLSVCWWKRNHNVHHIVTNSPEHDPDIEHMPFFAISHRFFDSLRSTYYDRVMKYDPFAKFMIRYQHYLYYPILTLGRFNLYLLSWEYLILGLGPRKGPARWHRWFEIAGQIFFWTWFGYGVMYRCLPTAWDRLIFLLISHVVTMPLHVQITLSHFAMSTSDMGVDESFAQKMLRTTMDVECPQWLDFFHGGLQFQAIHHLFPRIPRHNLRATQKLVMQFCEDVKIPYAIYGFLKGNEEVIGRLGEVGQQARVLAECQRAVARTAMDHM